MSNIVHFCSYYATEKSYYTTTYAAPKYYNEEPQYYTAPRQVQTL